MGRRMQCVAYGSERVAKAGRDREGQQRFRCAICGRRQTARSASAFCGYRFPDTVIALAVRWYLYYRLHYADVAELLAERGVHVDASTVFDWVQLRDLAMRSRAIIGENSGNGRWYRTTILWFLGHLTITGTAPY